MSTIAEFLLFAKKHKLNVVPLRHKQKVPEKDFDLDYYFENKFPIENIEKILQTEKQINVAVLCGKTSNYLVILDFDTDPNAEKAKMILGDIFNKTFVVKTPGGGVHIYLFADYVVRTFQISSRDLKIDVRGQGSYAVAPGSVHPNILIKGGETERWTYKIFRNLPIYYWRGEFEEELYELIKKAGYKIDTFDLKEPIDINLLLEGVEKGYRNSACIKIATYYRKEGLTEEECWHKILEWNKKNKPPEEDLKNLRTTVHSAYKKEDPYNYRFIFKEKTQKLTPEIESFLKNPNLHESTCEILDTIIVGEKELKMLAVYSGILAAVEEKPPGIIAISKLGSGKSYVLEEVAKIFPKSRVDMPTEISEKVVDYLAGNYSGRILFIDEIFGLEAGLPRIRIWMTKGHIEYWVVMGEVKKEKQVIKTEGCPSIWTTTTKTVEEQYGSRNFIAHTDPTQKQTTDIHLFQLLRSLLPKDAFEKEYKRREFLGNVILWILQNAKKVLIPYYFTFPSYDERARRDRLKLEKMIKAVANYYQLQREIIKRPDGTPYIIATEEDFNIALKILMPFLRETLTSLDSLQLAIFDFMNEKPELEYTAQEIHKALPHFRVGITTIKNRLKDLSEKGYVDYTRGRGGKEKSTYRSLSVSVGKSDIQIVKRFDFLIPLYKSSRFEPTDKHELLTRVFLELEKVKNSSKEVVVDSRYQYGQKEPVYVNKPENTKIPTDKLLTTDKKISNWLEGENHES